ncbi:hypothetical protein LXL04_007422 [Taraxacum kok-saghyz]
MDDRPHATLTTNVLYGQRHWFQVKSSFIRFMDRVSKSEHARQERFQVVRALVECKNQEGTSVYAHVQKMKGYIDRLGNLNVAFPNEL